MHLLLITITILAAATAAVATVLAWRVIDENRRRSEARIARLATEVNAVDPEPAPVTLAHLLDPLEGRGLPRSAALAGTVSLLLLLVVLSFGQLATGRALAESPPPAGPAAATTGPRPVDLVALTHHRRDDGALELRGEVRRAGGAAPLNRMTAVALLFDNQGTFLGSERAPLQPPSLDDDARATFVIAVPDAARVGRYRVSFRQGDRIVPHVDRREVPRGSKPGAR